MTSVQDCVPKDLKITGIMADVVKLVAARA